MKRTRYILAWILCLTYLWSVWLSACLASSYTPHQKPMLGELIDWSNPINKGLVLSLPMIEGAGGKVFDASGNGNHGTITGATWLPTLGGPGLDFGNSTSDVVDCGYPVDFTTLTGLTVICKFRPKTAAAQLIAENGTTYLANSFYIAQNSTTELAVVVSDGSDINSKLVITPYVPGSWYVVALVWESGQQVKAYCNGIDQSKSHGFNTMLCFI